MSDTQPSQRAIALKPDEKPTVEMAPPPAWAVELSKRVVDGFASVEARLDTVETNVTILVDDKRSVNDRLSRIETWKENEVNARLSANSERVRGESSVNLKQDAVISTLVTDVAAVKEAQATAATERAETAAAVKEIRDTVVTTASGLAKFFKHPKVVFVGKAVFTLAAAYMAAKGIKVLP
jgi:hypothetical protein